MKEATDMADKNDEPEIIITMDASPDEKGHDVRVVHITVKGGNPEKVADTLDDVVKRLLEKGYVVAWGGGGP
jgi:hypothetical protein